MDYRAERSARGVQAGIMVARSCPPGLNWELPRLACQQPAKRIRLTRRDRHHDSRIGRTPRVRCCPPAPPSTKRRCFLAAAIDSLNAALRALSRYISTHHRTESDARNELAPVRWSPELRLSSLLVTGLAPAVSSCRSYGKDDGASMQIGVPDVRRRRARRAWVRRHRGFESLFLAEAPYSINAWAFYPGGGLIPGILPPWIAALAAAAATAITGVGGTGIDPGARSVGQEVASLDLVKGRFPLRRGCELVREEVANRDRCADVRRFAMSDLDAGAGGYGHSGLRSDLLLASGI